MANFMNQNTENESVVRRFIEECINQRKLELVDELFSPAYVNNAATADISPDLAGYKQRLAYMVKGFPDLHLTIEDIFSVGNKVAIRLTVRGTHQEVFMGIPATGKHATWTAIAIFQIADGRVVQRWENRDDLGLFTQLGVVAK